ncbi:MAG TPA: alpha/beta hydrolase, partial [Gammaproteobacteria bacterium]|nr:alpha/beta hydrolase [Gammaproteobacteria bacterium]
MAKPEWYERAIAAARIDAEVTVDDCKIHYATWGEIGKPG